MTEIRSVRSTNRIRSLPVQGYIHRSWCQILSITRSATLRLAETRKSSTALDRARAPHSYSTSAHRASRVPNRSSIERAVLEQYVLGRLFKQPEHRLGQNAERVPSKGACSVLEHMTTVPKLVICVGMEE